MNHRVCALALAVVALAVYGDQSWPGDGSVDPSNRPIKDPFYRQIVAGPRTGAPVMGAGGILLTAETDRGCCVFQTPEPKCVFTNRAYCAQKAHSAQLNFEFHQSTNCKDVPVCQ